MGVLVKGGGLLGMLKRSISRKGKVLLVQNRINIGP
jgi:hypothetical protein